ncbi:flagellar hook assembly protein FlgD [Rhodothermus marinus]|uniref:flagellar hook assembly protein FlgD n=1 Tax=Rhodothermus marinus TaxID=29549 RepID=UPI000AC7AC9D|nr:flagellar hook capping FlgD N-terminal domain-containing protein [Rhodothermus marinus]
MPSLIAPIDEIRQQALQSTPSAPAPPSQELDKEAFLRLLVTQLRYQDPINPLDSREFAAQLAQFSTVEQLIGINETLAAQSDAYAALAQGIHNSVAAGLVGKVIEAEGDRLTWGGEDPVPFRIELGDAAQQVSIQIRNEAGEVVRTIFLSPKAAGEHAVEWDGKKRCGRGASRRHLHDRGACHRCRRRSGSGPLIRARTRHPRDVRPRGHSALDR